ncbi:MAG: glycine cleavage system aminomethyltransferase GcvT [Leptospiraceae bacterium]|nr:glycine cleavage system aminomethyltransferase GcvT [Leptospiraceae bacterium]
MALKAKMVPFGGWHMPVQYTGIIQEHLATREKAGLFDVSHMGEIFLEGDEKPLLSFLEKLSCNLVSVMQDGQVQYNAILNETGGLVDDITLYRFHARKYMICSNAANYEKVFERLVSVPHEGIDIRNESLNWHQIAIQGPLAEEILASVIGQVCKEIAYYRFRVLTFEGEELIVSRTGYTGEDGFEIYSGISKGIQLWEKLLETGNRKGLLPVGLGARDTLRLEAKYPLYGHELNAERSPVESGLSWIVKEKEDKYPEYEKILSEKKNGTEKSIAGIKLTETGIPREGYLVYAVSGECIGEVTSGTFSPSLKEGIGLAYLNSKYIQDEKEILVEIRNVKKKAVIYQKKFVQSGVKKNK